LKEHLEAARKQVEAMGDPRQEEAAGKRAARQRALRERQQRLEQALAELEKVRQAKQADKEQARASQSDPQARIMKQSDGGYAPSYNVQLSTEASNRVIVGAEVSQCGSDYGQLIGAVAQVEENVGANRRRSWSMVGLLRARTSWPWRSRESISLVRCRRPIRARPTNNGGGA
jgi:hypothetical protein